VRRPWPDAGGDPVARRRHLYRATAMRDTRASRPTLRRATAQQRPPTAMPIKRARRHPPPRKPVPLARRYMGRHPPRRNGRLMLTVLGGAGRVRERLDPHAHRRRTGARQSARRQARPQTEIDRSSEARGNPTVATVTGSQCARSPAATMSATARFRDCDGRKESRPPLCAQVATAYMFAYGASSSRSVPVRLSDTENLLSAPRADRSYGPCGWEWGHPSINSGPFRGSAGFAYYSYIDQCAH